jgi:hypothetical protein
MSTGATAGIFTLTPAGSSGENKFGHCVRCAERPDAGVVVLNCPATSAIGHGYVIAQQIASRRSTLWECEPQLRNSPLVPITYDVLKK